MYNDTDYLAETIALAIWHGEIEVKTDSKDKEYYHVDITMYPTEKLPTDKEELKVVLKELGDGILDVFNDLDDGNRMMGGDGIYTPRKIRIRKGKGESLLIYIR